MHGLEVIVLLGAATIALSVLARRVRVAPPLLLLLGGVALGFVPGVDGVHLPPDVVLFLFLPALLYFESLNTSLREILANLRVIVLLGTALVLVTAAAVAWAAHALGLAWPMAIVLGAVLAPTDATAVAAVAGHLPRRALTVLRAESLINDGTALVLYAVAVEAATTHHGIGPLGASARVVLSYAGGLLIGWVIAVVVSVIRRRLRDIRLENTLSVLTAFLAYLPAELVGVSGVVAVVTCGLVLSRVNPRQVSAATRVQAYGFWSVGTFVLNGSLFVLVGLQVRPLLDGLAADGSGAPGLGMAARDALAVAGVVIGTRLLWTFTTPYLIRALDRRPAQRLRRVGARQRLPLAWAGFRGAVSLAAALAVPAADVDGAPLAGRSLVLLLTVGVILVTLVVQGLTMPAVVRFARFPPDPSEATEQRLAERIATRSALDALDTRAADLGIDGAVVDGVRRDYQIRLRTLDEQSEDAQRAAVTAAKREKLAADRRLRAALLADKRAAIVRLRDSRDIDDTVLRRVQAQLDAEEVRLTGVTVED